MSKIFKYKYFLILFIIIAVNISILSGIIFFPYPELFIYSYLTTKGLLPYKQIIDQHFPGIMFFPINLISIGINTAEKAKFLNWGLVSLNHIFIFLIARKLFKSNYWVLLANVLYLIWHPFFEGFVLWIDTFVSTLLLISYYILIGGWKRIEKVKEFIAGLVLGTAFVFKQVILPLVTLLFLYYFLYQKKYRLSYRLLLGVFLPVFLMFVYIIKIDVLKDFLYWTVTFNLTTFAQLGRKYPTFLEILKLGWVFWPAFLAALIIFIKKPIKELIILCIFFICGMFFFYARSDFIHLQPSLAFCIILMIYLIRIIPKRLLYLLAIFYFLGSMYLLIPFYRWAVNNKQTLFFGEKEERIVSEVRKYANKDDSVFSFATVSHLNYLTETIPPGKVFVFPFPWFMLKAENKILEGVKKDPPKVVVMDKFAQVEGVNLVSYTPRIKEYIEKNYNVVNSFDQTEILVPR
ncbi:hypothetical protein A2159_01115 [Candidatus Woesebacteria bacterium RBG_13_34_9]|uniref:Glycosyltransferase RgtA/B/C/D-like domain-containing protein n=1 Tax=Candidatus Woesebacteria bacterium RBG_13_34_9 TaxID=1802477 RepID=A0A1F7X6J7_9BACT|nr:MAG: hypothetical protein A2159_01115 [Candidatus Woesebacteria bacterium RBG_13_34_9]